PIDRFCPSGRHHPASRQFATVGRGSCRIYSAVPKKWYYLCFQRGHSSTYPMRIAARCLFLMLVVQSQLYAQDFSRSKNPAGIKREIEQRHASTKSLQADFNEEVSSVMFAEPQK